MLNLTRSDFLVDGIFGELSNDNETFSCHTLEHAYLDDENNEGYAPKVPPGVYTCVRGMHQLAGMSGPFETFEITNVPNHTGILFHPGNVNADSEGCVLLGLERQGDKQILQSRLAFEAFMKLVEAVDSFELTVS